LVGRRVSLSTTRACGCVRACVCGAGQALTAVGFLAAVDKLPGVVDTMVHLLRAAGDAARAASVQDAALAYWQVRTPPLHAHNCAPIPPALTDTAAPSRTHTHTHRTCDLCSPTTHRATQAGCLYHASPPPPRATHLRAPHLFNASPSARDACVRQGRAKAAGEPPEARRRSALFAVQILRDKASGLRAAGDAAGAAAALEAILAMGGDTVDASLRSEVAALLVLAGCVKK
jgi:hypothetical protein